MRATQYRIRRFTYLQATASIPLLFFFCLGATHTSFAQNLSRSRSQTSRRAASDSSIGIPQAILLNILRAEDERRWDADLAALFSNPNAVVRSRAALAAGRIGDEGAVAPLVALLRNDADANVREMAAFALGETEAAAGADALLELLVQPCGRNAGLRARALESLGKIAPALPEAEKERRALVGNAVLAALRRELDCTLTENREVVLAGLTAILRARPADAGKTIKSLLNSSDARVRADTANALARLRSKDANAELRSRLADLDSIVRATAARALGAAEDKDSFDELLARATGDADVRVRVSAVRALASLKNARAAAALQRRADSLFVSYRQSKKTRTRAVAHPTETNELLELANTLGALLANTGDERALEWLRALRGMEGTSDPEIEIAFARIAPLQYLRDPLVNSLSRSSRSSSAKLDWRVVASIAQGLGELARPSNQTSGNDSFRADALLRLRSLVDNGAAPALALPDALTALAAFKPEDLDTTLRKQLTANDFYVRATAANLLGELAPSEANTIALLAALPRALGETTNDAALAILDALAKQKSEKATSAIKTGLDSNDYLVRRRAASLLKSLGAGEYASRIGTVNTRNTVADYQLALARRGKLVRAVVLTHKGKFTIELLPDDAPLTVDNFIKLARQRFFDATTFHRVVPNFVIQGGDPRGDGNGGPPYQIRCEINRVSYARGAVGMALSGKDTGGSQWFVTHSPQPHLDGGYTVFGRVTEGMDVVDGIVRGDRILSVRIVEERGTPARVRVNQ